MRLGACARKQQYQDVILEGNVIENVKSYKLLGVHVTETLKWDVHITAMLYIASKRIHFLKQLRQACELLPNLLLNVPTNYERILKVKRAVFRAVRPKTKTRWRLGHPVFKSSSSNNNNR